MNDSLPRGVASRASARFVEMVLASKVISLCPLLLPKRKEGAYMSKSSRQTEGSVPHRNDLLCLGPGAGHLLHVGKQEQPLFMWTWTLIHLFNTDSFLDLLCARHSSRL